MFRFSRELILPLVLATRTGITKLARRADVNPKTFFRAINGKPVGLAVVDKIAVMLGIDPLKFLVDDNKPTASI